MRFVWTSTDDNDNVLIDVSQFYKIEECGRCTKLTAHGGTVVYVNDEFMTFMNKISKRIFIDNQNTPVDADDKKEMQEESDNEVVELIKKFPGMSKTAVVNELGGRTSCRFKQVTRLLNEGRLRVIENKKYYVNEDGLSS